MKRIINPITTGLCILWILASTSAAQNSTISWYTFDMGFAIPSSSNTAAKSAVGQVFVGATQSVNTRVESGFLADTLLRGTIVSVGENFELPLSFSLSQNYPNPFNPSTTIRFEIPHRSKVELRVYSILGQQVATLVDEEKDAGRYHTVWDGRNSEGIQVGSGVYFYRLRARQTDGGQAGEFVETKKLILLR